ncbi:MAG TPA: hypothetical protein VFF48_12605 [Brevundimonas sp.]|nr:hypothetical protein [Brevundimonas sp.]
MRCLIVAAALVALATSPALAQSAEVGDSRDSRATISAIDGRTSGILATTPTRIASSRREMNRGRETRWAMNATPSQLRTFAERSLRRGGFHCTVAEVKLVAQLLDETPIVEVACQEDGGVIIADSDPVQFSDCLDLVNATGPIGPCRIPRNVALVNASRQ